MNKLFKGLLATALAVSCSAIAKDHSNKTFLMPRPAGVDLPMEHTSWDYFTDRHYDRHDDKGFGGNLNVTGFYSASGCGKGLGQYFAPCGSEVCDTTECETKCSSKGCDGYVFTLERTAPAAAISSVDAVDLGYIIHRSATENAITEKATVGLNPEHNIWGVRFDYYQDLDCIVKGLFFRANLPVVNVTNDMHLAVCSADNANTKQQIIDYFAGKTVKIGADADGSGDETNVVEGINQQAALCKAKICGKRDKTGVADIDLALGYRALNKEDYHMSIAFGLTIPTGNTPDGKWLFEPVVGNGGHVGIGFDVDGNVKVWNDEDQNLQLYGRMKYRYLLEDCEHRVLGLGTTDGPSCAAACDTNCETKCTSNCPPERPWGQYHLLGKAGQNQLVPAANVLCQKVDVTPGSQFDGIIGMHYGYENFDLDLGYNLYYREAEKVRLKAKKSKCDTSSSCDSKCPTTCANLNDYSVAARSFNTTAAFQQNEANSDTNVTAKAKLNDGSRVLTCPASTPSQLTHSVYGGIGYAFMEWDYPVLFRLGGKYEFKDDNASIERWAIWGGFGVAF